MDSNKFLISGFVAIVVFSLFGITANAFFLTPILPEPNHVLYYGVPIPIPGDSFSAPGDIGLTRGPKAKPIKIEAIALVTILSPSNGTQYNETDTFNVDVRIDCLNGRCNNVIAEMVVPAGLSLPSSDYNHSLGTLREGENATTYWVVSADSAGNHTMTVNSYVKNKFSNSSSLWVEVISQPEPELCELNVNVTYPIEGMNFSVGDNFSTVAVIKNIGSGTCYSVNATISYNETSLDLIHNDSIHIIGDLLPSEESTEIWDFEAIAPDFSYITVVAKDENGVYDGDFTWVIILPREPPVCELNIMIIQPASGTEFGLNETFQTIANITNIGNDICYYVNVTLEVNNYSLILTNNDSFHSLGNLSSFKSVTQTWNVTTISPDYANIYISAWGTPDGFDWDSIYVKVLGGKALVEIIYPTWGTEFGWNETFNLTVNISCPGSGDDCYGVRSNTSEYDPMILFLVNNDPFHWIGNMQAGSSVMDSWEFQTIAFGNSSIVTLVVSSPDRVSYDDTFVKVVP